VRPRYGHGIATFVLIHGAADTAWAWGFVAAELRERGHDAIAVDLPCDDDSAGLTAYADTVVDAIGDRTDLVVVAHSLGGFTAPLVCARVPARLLVLTAAMVPAPGETADEWWTTSGYMEAAGSQPDRPDDEIALFLHDAPPERAAEMVARGRGQSGTPTREPWPLDAWPDVPTRYVLFRDDRFFPADFLRRLARERLGVVADEIDGSHCAYLSRPEELAARLDGYLSR
jgi:alpha-beta hydrolase superfamily lysophospholipase